MHVKIPANRVQTPGCPNNSEHPRLEIAHRHLVSHVRVLTRIRARVQARDAHIRSRRHADRRIGEGRHEIHHRFGMDADRRVGVHYDVARQVGASGVLRRCLAAPLQHAEQVNTARREATHDVVRFIRGGIRDDEDLAPLGGIVDLENPLERAANHRGLVIDGQRDADPRPRIRVLRWHRGPPEQT